ncbi:MAG: hypothetical protein IT162_14340 [Bryobacterales bacterium]|nr:hypothetical protein [Bryobacterales bacterium]
MTPPVFELPIKASEAAAVADIVFQALENRRLQEDVRHRLASRGATLGLTSVRPWWGSLAADPVHASVYYLAADGLGVHGDTLRPLLLRLALASAPASALYPKSLLIGRMRPGGGREVVVNAIDFGPGDAAALETYTQKIDRTFLPRPQASAPALTVVPADPEKESGPAFEAFRLLQRSLGANVASFAARPGLSARTMSAATWAAIRAGWREGYSVEAEPLALDQPDLLAAARLRAGFSRFRVALTGVAGAPEDPAVLEWAAEEFGARYMVGPTVYQFDEDKFVLLLSRYGRALQAVERLVDLLRTERAARGLARTFDLDLVVPSADPESLLFCLHWLKARGRAATHAAPSIGNEGEAAQAAAIARHSGATLSFDAEVLDTAPHAQQWTGGRWNCRVTGGGEITSARLQAIGAQLRM